MGLIAYHMKLIDFFYARKLIIELVVTQLCIFATLCLYDLVLIAHSAGCATHTFPW